MHLTLEEYIIEQLQKDPSPWGHTLWESLGPDSLHVANDIQQNRAVNNKVITLLANEDAKGLGEYLLENAWKYLGDSYQDDYYDYVASYEQERAEWLHDTMN